MAFSRKEEGLSDKWTIREKLCLVHAVEKEGSKNWVAVSIGMKSASFSENAKQQKDWYSPGNCEKQYRELLRNLQSESGAASSAYGKTANELLNEQYKKKRQEEILAGLQEIAELKSEIALLQGELTHEQALQMFHEEQQYIEAATASNQPASANITGATVGQPQSEKIPELPSNISKERTSQSSSLNEATMAGNEVRAFPAALPSNVPKASTSQKDVTTAGETMHAFPVAMPGNMPSASTYQPSNLKTTMPGKAMLEVAEDMPSNIPTYAKKAATVAHEFASDMSRNISKATTSPHSSLKQAKKTANAGREFAGDISSNMPQKSKPSSPQEVKKTANTGREFAAYMPSNILKESTSQLSSLKAGKTVYAFPAVKLSNLPKPSKSPPSSLQEEKKIANAWREFAAHMPSNMPNKSTAPLSPLKDTTPASKAVHSFPVTMPSKMPKESKSPPSSLKQSKTANAGRAFSTDMPSDSQKASTSQPSLPNEATAAGNAVRKCAATVPRDMPKGSLSLKAATTTDETMYAFPVTMPSNTPKTSKSPPSSQNEAMMTNTTGRTFPADMQSSIPKESTSQLSSLNETTVEGNAVCACAVALSNNIPKASTSPTSSLQQELMPANATKVMPSSVPNVNKSLLSFGQVTTAAETLGAYLAAVVVTNSESSSRPAAPSESIPSYEQQTVDINSNKSQETVVQLLAPQIGGPPTDASILVPTAEAVDLLRSFETLRSGRPDPYKEIQPPVLFTNMVKIDDLVPAVPTANGDHGTELPKDITDANDADGKMEIAKAATIVTSAVKREKSNLIPIPSGEEWPEGGNLEVVTELSLLKISNSDSVISSPSVAKKLPLMMRRLVDVNKPPKNSSPLIEPLPGQRLRCRDSALPREKALKQSLLNIVNDLEHKKNTTELHRVFREHRELQHICQRPVDMRTIKEKIESGDISTITELQRDLMLLGQNALMLTATSSNDHESAKAYMLDLQAIPQFKSNPNPSENNEKKFVNGAKQHFSRYRLP